jgi:uncharacterized protein YxjI
MTGATVAAFGGYRRLTVRQRRPWRATHFTKNDYLVYDEDQSLVLRIEEQRAAGAWSALGRKLLGSQRAFSLVVCEEPGQRPLLRLERPLAWRDRLQVTTADGDPLGRILRRGSWRRRHYRIEDSHGGLLAELDGALLGDTFRLTVAGEERGRIARRSAPFLQELFKSDGDRFAVDVAALSDARLKALVVAATLLVDAAHFQLWEDL